MIDINEALTLFQNGNNTYYSLWVFYYTASAGILGFLYSSINNSQLIKIMSATVLYAIIVVGNSQAIFTTQEILFETRDQLCATLKLANEETGNFTTQEIIYETKGGLPIKPSESKVNITNLVQLLHISNLCRVKIIYWCGTFIVFLGIWFPYVLNVSKNGFKATII